MTQVTIRDIAQATGLSSGTISRALKNQAGKLVAKGTGITVVRNPDAAKK